MLFIRLLLNYMFYLLEIFYNDTNKLFFSLSFMNTNRGQVSCDSNEAVSDAEPHPSVVSHARSHEGTQGVHWTPRHSYDVRILYFRSLT